jgi:drug/metabolite transporter (DMT)-like permease
MFAAVVGVAGVVLLFLPELLQVQGSAKVALGIAYGLGGTVLATCGNLIAVRNHSAKLGVFEGAAWGMGWGAATAALIAFVRGVPWSIETRPAYLLSLAYLAVFGSIVAFGAYLTLIKKVGAAPQLTWALQRRSLPCCCPRFSKALPGLRPLRSVRCLRSWATSSHSSARCGKRRANA